MKRCTPRYASWLVRAGTVLALWGGPEHVPVLAQDKPQAASAPISPVQTPPQAGSLGPARSPETGPPLLYEPVISADEKAFAAFLNDYLKTATHLTVEEAHSYWQACASGSEADYAKVEALEKQSRHLHSDAASFARLKAWRSAGAVHAPLLARQLDIVYNHFAQNQLKPAQIEQLVELSTRIEKIFNTHRGTYQGRLCSDNELLDVLSREPSSARRREAWEAQKSVGREVAPLLLQLVRLRNQVARELGYRNFYAMSLELDEEREVQVFRIFDDLARRSEAPYREVKAEVDRRLAARWGISADTMQPWHYQDFFFQEAPVLGDLDLDVFFARQDVVRLVTRFYQSLNLDPSPVLAQSDLFERKGKYQHAQCSDLDREGDVRIMCNVRNNANWAKTLLHELGHGVYAYYCDRRLPFLLRDSAHTLTTEGIAQMFEQQIYDPRWLVEVAGADPKIVAGLRERLDFQRRMSELVFCRWSQVMAHFERALYQDPDQDLDDLWWRLVERYQHLRRPEGRHAPDWASKIHLVSAPCYYQDYLLGNLFGAQLLHTMKRLPGKHDASQGFSFVQRPDLGAWLTAYVFYPGARMQWEELLRTATGEPLQPRYYIDEYLSKKAK